jgi:hypothetical protein
MIAVTTAIRVEILSINFSLIPQIWKTFAFKKAAVKVKTD